MVAHVYFMSTLNIDQEIYCNKSKAARIEMKKEKKPIWVFLFQEYGKFWSISLDIFIKHKPWNCKVWGTNQFLNIRRRRCRILDANLEQYGVFTELQINSKSALWKFPSLYSHYIAPMEFFWSFMMLSIILGPTWEICQKLAFFPIPTFSFFCEMKQMSGWEKICNFRQISQVGFNMIDNIIKLQKNLIGAMHGLYRLGTFFKMSFLNQSESMWYSC